jgi:hypothetical protein
MHTVRWEAGRLTLPAHADMEAELVLGALGGDKPGCVTLAETWDRHAGALAVLTAGPRSTADLVTVTWEQVAEQRAHWFAAPRGAGQGTARVATRPMRPASPGSPPASPLAPPPPAAYPPAAPPPAPGRPAAAAAIAAAASGMVRRPGFPGGRAPASGQGGAEFASRARQRFELLELLALGPAFQFRLSGTVAAAWAVPSRADERAGRRPELTAALSGRLAPAAEAWLGVDPDAVAVIPHEGPGWGSLHVTGAGDGRRLRAALPVSWLSDVWASGLAAVDGHLVIAVEEPGYPRARVLALRAPDAPPVRLDVIATDAGPGAAGPGPGAGTGAAVPRWSVSRAGGLPGLAGYPGWWVTRAGGHGQRAAGCVQRAAGRRIVGPAWQG